MAKTTLRFIDTQGLPQGFDVADLIAQGTEGQALVDWCKARVRDGNVPPEPRPEPVSPAPGRSSPPAAQPQKSPTEPGDKVGLGAGTGEGRRREVETATRAPASSTPTVIGHASLAHGEVALLPRSPPQAAPEPDELQLPPEYSDDSLAREFTRQYSGTYLYVSSWGRWLTWDNVRWRHDETGSASHAARMMLREQANEVLQREHEFKSRTRGIANSISSARTIGNVIQVARVDPRHAATSSQFDDDKWALNTPDGLVDLRTGTIREGSMRDYCTKVTNVGPAKDCPTWHAFLHDVTDGDTEMQLYLQRVAGYCLTGLTTEHALFFFYGTGRNGKGTFINTLEWIMGDYAKVASMDTFTESKNERHSTDVAALMGARIVTSQETDEGKRWAEARIKSMTGGDPITARFMRQDDFTYVPQFKLMISGNHRPGLRNVDEAMRARLHLIPFTVTVPAEKRDPRLSEKLRAEAGGILLWAIEGCKEWQRIRLAPPAAVRRATDEYFGSQDVIQQWVDDCCEVRPGNTSGPSELYEHFRRYANAAGEFVVPMKRWKDALELKGIHSTRSNGARQLRGVRLKSTAGEALFGE